MNKYELKKKIKKISSLLVIYGKRDEKLFFIGEHDVFIYNYSCKSSIYQDKQSSFDYGNKENALIGKTGTDCFTTKRILVLQMK